MTSPAGELAASPTSPPTLAYGDVSADTSYLFNGTDTLWWQFVAPETGLYAFDTGLCNVGGAAPTPDVPFANIAAYALDGSPLPAVAGGNIEGTSQQWTAVSLTAGDAIFVQVVAVSSLADFIAGTNVAVNTNAHSDLLDALTLTTLDPVGLWSAVGDESTLTVTRPTVTPSPISAQIFALICLTNGTTAPTTSIDSYIGSLFFREGTWAGGYDAIGDPVSPATYSYTVWYGWENNGIPSTVTFGIGDATDAIWMAVQVDMGTAIFGGTLTSGSVEAYSSGAGRFNNVTHVTDADVYGPSLPDGTPDGWLFVTGAYGPDAIAWDADADGFDTPVVIGGNT